MVVADRGHGVVQETEPVDDPRALVGVPLHQRPLLVGEDGRLEQDRVGDGELADVVEQRRVAEEVELRLREAQLAADREGELLHAPRVAGRVGVAGVDRRREALHRRRRALLQEAVRLLERDVLALDRLCRRAELLGALLRVPQVCLLGLAHEEQRHGEHRERVEARRVVGDRHHAAHEAVHDPVRGQPREALLPDAPHALVTLHRDRDAQQAGVDREVGEAGSKARGGREELADGALRSRP